MEDMLIQRPSSNKKSSGPPNRLNDLDYKTWMKFQKSFFRFVSMESTSVEFLKFFTKSVWPDGHHSNIFVWSKVGVKIQDLAPRDITQLIPTGKISDLNFALENLLAKNQKLDYAFIDLTETLDESSFLSDDYLEIFKKIKESLEKLILTDRFCTIAIEGYGNGEVNYPIAWIFGSSLRGKLRLKDEKIGLRNCDQKPIYFQNFQSNEGEKIDNTPSREDFKVANNGPKFPAWLIPKPKPRSKEEILHPAKYPEELISQFIKMFTNEGQVVFDPMIGTGSTAIAALRHGRNAYGIELEKEFSEISSRRVFHENSPDLFGAKNVIGEIFNDDIRNLKKIHGLKKVDFDYVITSPPYWSMLRNPGSENQKARKDKDLKLHYSENPKDFGNIIEYDKFLNELTDIYELIGEKMPRNSFLTVIVKNIKRNHILNTLAWDLSYRLCKTGGKFEFVGNTFWCQDDVGLKPFGIGTHWVSNILHQYCLHFKRT